jgi:hydroxyacylglutathione hydrolase
MFFRQFVLPSLGHASYLVGDPDSGQAVLVDPRRDVGGYLEAASAAGLRVAYVLDTHGHNDYLSGVTEVLAGGEATALGFEGAGLGYPHLALGDGDTVELGALVLRLLHTPGHTPEHVGVLVSGEGADGPGLLLSGGALLVGSVGRPDLLGGLAQAREGALALHQTLHQRLAGLPDDLPVYPTHLAGSLCGAGIGDARSTTLGWERRVNAAFTTGDPARFAADLLRPDHLPAVPPHWRRMRPQNLAGPPPLGPVAAPAALAPAAFAAAALGGAVVLDVRDPGAFAAGHVPGSLNVPVDGAFPTWAGTVLGEHARTVLVAGGPAEVQEATWGLLRVGLAAPAGVLAGGMDAWEAAGQPVTTLTRLDAGALRRRAGAGELEPLDVRQPGEWAAGHLEGARLLTAAEVPGRLGELPRSRTWGVLCEGGYRSSVVASLLLREGFEAATLAGGMRAWRAAGLPIAGPAA